MPDSADASSPDAFDAADAHADAGATDGNAEDAEDAPAEAEDAGTTAPSCPDAAPPGATSCCGSTPCVERQGNACNCAQCMNCSGVCCADMNGHTSCVATAADCD
jgi:hypothetical protein